MVRRLSRYAYPSATSMRRKKSSTIPVVVPDPATTYGLLTDTGAVLFTADNLRLERTIP